MLFFDVRKDIWTILPKMTKTLKIYLWMLSYMDLLVKDFMLVNSVMDVIECYLFALNLAQP